MWQCGLFINSKTVKVINISPAFNNIAPIEQKVNLFKAAGIHPYNPNIFIEYFNLPVKDKLNC